MGYFRIWSSDDFVLFRNKNPIIGKPIMGYHLLYMIYGKHVDHQ